MPQSQTADQPLVPLGRDTEHREPQHNYSKQTAKMIAKLQTILRTTPQKKDPTQKNPHTMDGSKNEQQINNNRIALLERITAYATRHYMYLTGQIFALDSGVV